MEKRIGKISGEPYYVVDYKPRDLVGEELDIYKYEPRPRQAPEILVFWADKLRRKTRGGETNEVFRKNQNL